MRYCPNPSCRTRIRGGRPAEFLDHVTVCNDCGIALVAAEALGTAESLRAVANEKASAERDRLADPAESPLQSVPTARVEVMTGIALIALSVVLAGTSFLMAYSAGGGTYFLAIGPFIYGIVRVTRGVGMQKP